MEDGGGTRGYFTVESGMVFCILTFALPIKAFIKVKSFLIFGLHGNGSGSMMVLCAGAGKTGRGRETRRGRGPGRGMSVVREAGVC